MNFTSIAQDTNSISRNEFLGQATGFRIGSHSLMNPAGKFKRYHGERFSFDIEHFGKYRFITSYGIDFYHVNPDHHKKDDIYPFINYHFTLNFRVNRFQKSNSIWTIGISAGTLYDKEIEYGRSGQWNVKRNNPWIAFHTEYRYLINNCLQLSARVEYGYNDYFNSTFSTGFGIHYLPFHSGIRKIKSESESEFNGKDPVVGNIHKTIQKHSITSLYLTSVNLGAGLEQTLTERNSYKKPYFCLEAGYTGSLLVNLGMGYYSLQKHSIDAAFLVGLDGFDDFVLSPRVGYRHNSQGGFMWRVGAQLYIIGSDEIIPLPFLHLGYTIKQPEIKKKQSSK